MIRVKTETFRGPIETYNRTVTSVYVLRFILVYRRTVYLADRRYD